MAITLEQLRSKHANSADEMYAFTQAAGYLMGCLEQYRERCLALGLPFCGKLEKNYQEIHNSLHALGTDGLDFDHEEEALTAALETMDKLGGFLNVVIGPGERTIRDALAEQDREQQNTTQRRESFDSEADEPTAANSLDQVSKFLELSAGREEAPLFDYWRESMPQPEAVGQNLGPMLKEPASTALTRMRRALRDSGSNEDRVRLLADIFGARIAAGATRNDKSHLERTEITSRQVNVCAEELMKNPLFQSFAAENMPELLRLAQKRGHGGLLEERFEQYLLKLPGGKLRNDPILKRYMPNCKERINVLKKQIKERSGLGDACDPMAEIVVLRGLVRADRHNVDSLNVPIPTDPSNSLGSCAEILAYKPEFQECVADAIGAAEHGHGGRMVEALRTAEKKNSKGKQSQDPTNFTKLMLNKTTYQGRMLNLQLRAFSLREQIRHGRPVDEQVKLQYRDLCLENFGLSDQVINEHIPSGSDVDEVRVREKKEILGQTQQFSLANTGALKEEDVTQGLKTIIETKNMGYHVPQHFPNRIGGDGKLRADSLEELDKSNDLELI